MSWLTNVDLDEGTVNVVPLDDLVVHEFDVHCGCGPAVEVHMQAHMPDLYLLIHQAYDGRECHE